jgi:outer membrane protein OmpA-like peptidoglycan-associated protein
MERNLLQTLMVMAGVLLAAGLAGAESDAEGSKDPPLFTRMPGWYINQYEENEFASHDFTGDKGNSVTVEGHKIAVSYTWGGTGKKPSSLQVVRNYENALKKIGGTVPYRKGDFFLTLKLVKNGKETWAEIASEVDAGWGGYTLTIVEKDVMVQEVTASAASMSADIKATGHVAVYGINFDADKSDIRPDAEAAIAEIAKLLKEDASLKVFVVGHTANVGSVETSLKLSQARADAVAKYLTAKYGIESARLSSFGAGPYCPVSTNLTEEGRAKNRRVELVQQ